MGRKTVAELEAENKALKEQLSVVPTEIPVVESEVVEENKQLKFTVAEMQAKEARLVDDIKTMGENIADMKTMSDVNNGFAHAGILVMTPDGYHAYSKKNGRIMGREKGVKTECSIEELRALINSNWKPSMVMEKHGIDAEELKQLVWALSQKELRGKSIKFSIESDFFGKEG